MKHRLLYNQRSRPLVVSLNCSTSWWWLFNIFSHLLVAFWCRRMFKKCTKESRNLSSLHRILICPSSPPLPLPSSAHQTTHAQPQHTHTHTLTLTHTGGWASGASGPPAGLEGDRPSPRRSTMMLYLLFLVLFLGAYLTYLHMFLFSLRIVVVVVVYALPVRWAPLLSLSVCGSSPETWRSVSSGTASCLTANGPTEEPSPAGGTPTPTRAGAGETAFLIIRLLFTRNIGELNMFLLVDLNIQRLKKENFLKAEDERGAENYETFTFLHYGNRYRRQILIITATQTNGAALALSFSSQFKNKVHHRQEMNLKPK